MFLAKYPIFRHLDLFYLLEKTGLEKTRSFNTHCCLKQKRSFGGHSKFDLSGSKAKIIIQTKSFSRYYLQNTHTHTIYIYIYRFDQSEKRDNTCQQTITI